ncbi:MAG: tRNA pseudouridine(38-40) synthase TruA [Bacteroidetes bacterium HGW-Bacteroidetes-6]|jgi:tRNA pseudouridine38-40 synthase|nr:MAG: tRNA pseudouridine(38-40) synthase TruA [Bacteroidetes bacterium HGW-Bacteroidetes-6]
MRFGIHLCYNGKNYAGWQRQQNALSIQEELEKALSVLLKSEISITGCGRTDTGVHASNFYAHFDYESALPENLVYHCNAIIGKGIRVFGFFEAPDTWHARFSATKRTYRYRLLLQKNPFFEELAWQVPYELDIERMQAAASHFIGKANYASFAKLHGSQSTNICEIYYTKLTRIDDFLIFEISADRFLRNMVRAITGTIIDAGRGRIEPDEIATIIQQKSRNAAGASVPAKGLFLSSVEYSDSNIPLNKYHNFPIN